MAYTGRALVLRYLTVFRFCARERPKNAKEGSAREIRGISTGEGGGGGVVGPRCPLHTELYIYFSEREREILYGEQLAADLP